ncbi:MAG: rod shape-determining protein RodA [Gemmatimonadetes bacterium]|nr:rod shape-determining protein RodA [Gemmatimonadota bacterium]MBK6779306.1 rod shape-determining protein RodA [Gemmatimonadota bacterium]MBK7348381.1 rod shape-determining protein RodA [Gemmatimonadota bacterium]MBK7713951.1 rod shape-determining protein RodA [Gemmatimonadota bacterium]MBK7783006.1 rod shape-determining protein RodA [Gemmatimonadota bacterium]
MPRSMGLDRSLLGAVGALFLFGLVVLYSAGQTDVPSFAAAGAWERQLVWLGGGAVVAAIAFRFSPRLLEWASLPVYVVALLLLLLTLVVGRGAGTAASSKSWIYIGGHAIGQPAEFAKLAVLLMLARHLSGLREAPETMRDLMPATLIAGIPALLVLAQPDLGSALVFAGILFAMLFWAGVHPILLVFLASPIISLLLAFTWFTWVGWMLLLGVALVVWRPYFWEGVALFAANSAMGFIALPIWRKLEPYQQNRLLTFLNPEVDPQKAGYHAIQSKVAIGSGGWLGNGYLEGPQKRLAFLPEQHTDFIFAVVGEELGFLGVLLALVLFFMLFTILVRIARRATDPYSSLMVFGILGLLFTHVFENVGMTVNVMPITGIPLPFFSYGGSFLLSTAVTVGLCLRAAWDARLGGYGDV